ncbi:glycosyltransferase family 2 protein [Parasediminibacterium paludis]|uniref:Glycosyltransferase family 2 protein n=1 Tax=Parasediminibacterium paludis TaxID=908966 RepID=A0ABV8PYL5_9BACT
MRPIPIPKHILSCWQSGLSNLEKIDRIKANYSQLQKDKPQVSIVIPAYNEEANILQTLLSLCSNSTRYSVEIIVVNNNSQDATEQLVRASGVTCINELKAGITAARTAGLMAAKGKYILNADADTIYPIDWIELMIIPLESNRVALTYGRFAFIPVGNTGRLSYVCYEYITDMIRWVKKYTKDEAVNVYGFNSAYRREDGLQVDGYQHPPGSNEDGYLALKLRNNGYGKLHLVTNYKALVWTTDRRIQTDGGFVKAVFQRLKNLLWPSKQFTIRQDL